MVDYSIGNPYEFPWKPYIRISDDDQPLANDITDLWSTFPNERNNGPLSWWNLPTTPLILVTVYVLLKAPFKTLCRSLGFDGTSFLFKALCALHNFALCLYSFVTHINAWTIVLQRIFSVGIRETYCDTDHILWNSGFGTWTFIFYLSKYYEFLDTAILIVKNKEPSFLQVFHHSGVVLSMWGGVVCQGMWIWAVVLLNSGIHTLMYLYYFAATFKIKFSWAKYLTRLQIAQFVFGIGGTLPVHFMSCFDTTNKSVTLFIQTYVVGLIILFWGFYKQKYNKSQKTKQL